MRDHTKVLRFQTFFTMWFRGKANSRLDISDGTGIRGIVLRVLRWEKKSFTEKFCVEKSFGAGISCLYDWQGWGKMDKKQETQARLLATFGKSITPST